MLDKITIEKFKGLIGSTAMITIMNGPDISLTLEEVHETKVTKQEGRPDDCRKKPFTLILSGSENHQAPDGVYDISFDKIGLMEGVYIDNRAENPESKAFNESKLRAPKRKSAQKSASNGHKEAAVPAEALVLYEISFS